MASSKISDGTHTRYLYAPELVRVISSQQTPVLGITAVTPTQFRIGVNGVSGKTIVLESSPDLKNWVPVATNALFTGLWIYTNNSPTALPWQFYRALVSP